MWVTCCRNSFRLHKHAIVRGIFMHDSLHILKNLILRRKWKLGWAKPTWFKLLKSVKKQCEWDEVGRVKERWWWWGENEEEEEGGREERVQETLQRVKGSRSPQNGRTPPPPPPHCRWDGDCSVRRKLIKPLDESMWMLRKRVSKKPGGNDLDIKKFSQSLCRLVTVLKLGIGLPALEYSSQPSFYDWKCAILFLADIVFQIKNHYTHTQQQWKLNWGQKPPNTRCRRLVAFALRTPKSCWQADRRCHRAS